MKIGFGCDHTAVELKLALMDHLREQGHECVDYGTKEAGVRMDYPVVGKRVAEAVAGKGCPCVRNRCGYFPFRQ